MIESCSVRETAIIGGSIRDDVMELGEIEVKRNLGLWVPEDVTIVGFGDSPTACYADPALTSPRAPIRDLSRPGARRLLELLEGSRFDPNTEDGLETPGERLRAHLEHDPLQARLRLQRDAFRL